MEKYSIKEAAKMCGVKVRTMRQWIRDGRIRADKHDNGWYWMIPDTEVMRVNQERSDYADEG